MEKAFGKYICFVDQDDIAKQDMFQTLINDMEQKHADFEQGGVAHSIDEKVLSHKEFPQVLQRETAVYEQSFGALIIRGGAIKTEYKIDCNIWNKIYRVDFLKKYQIKFQRFLDYEDDWLFVIEAMKYAQAVTIRKEVVYIWRTNLKSEIELNMINI